MIRKWSMLAALLLSASLTTGCVVEVEPEDDTIELNEDYAYEEDEAEIEESEDALVAWDDPVDASEEAQRERVILTGVESGFEPGEGEGSAFSLISGGPDGGGDDRGPDPQPWHGKEDGPDPQPWKTFETANHAAGPDPQPW